MKKLTQEKYQELIMEQFKIAKIEWVTFEDLKKLDKEWKEWYSNWEVTQKQNDKWCKYLAKELKDYAPKYRVAREVQRFNLQAGLKIKDLKEYKH